MVDDGLSQNEQCVINYFNRWLQSGALVHHPKVATILAQAVPSAMRLELIFAAMVDEKLSVYCKQHSSEHPIYPNMWHFLGAAPELRFFVGNENEHEIKNSKDGPRLGVVIEKAKQDKLLWDAPSILERMLRWILRNEELGLSEEQIVHLAHTNLDHKRFGFGTCYDWTPEGPQGAQIFTVSLGPNVIKGSGRWIPLGEIADMASMGMFVKHQATWITQGALKRFSFER